MLRVPKAIMFDMGDTLIQYLSFEPIKANKMLLKYANNPNNVTAEHIQELALELTEELYGKRDIHNIEINMRSFQRLLYEMCGISFDMSELELESLFNRNAFGRKAMPGVNKFLSYLDESRIRTGIISNSSFSKDALQQELIDCGINHNFEFIISSMGYCIRKPDKRLFQIGLKKLDLKPEEVWYIGNSFKYDMVGARNAGIQGVWLNNEEEKSSSNIDIIEFNCYYKLLEDLKQLMNLRS